MQWATLQAATNKRPEAKENVATAGVATDNVAGGNIATGLEAKDNVATDAIAPQPELNAQPCAHATCNTQHATDNR